MKRIDQIDPNFQLPDSVPADTQFMDAQQPPFSVWGLADNKPGVYCRLPESFLPLCNEGVQYLAYHLAGACVRFSTDAKALSVVWELREAGNMPHFAASGQSGLQLLEETDHGVHNVHQFIPAMDDGRGCRLKQSAHIELPGGLRHYALYLPLYNGLSQLLLGFPSGAQVLPGRTPRIERPLVFYGSSITQGGCASKVGSCYTTLLARRLDAAQINLGFSGSGRGEASMARYIAGLTMSIFVLDYDHNAPDTQHLAATHEPFFKIVREAQPDLPIVMVSRPNFEANPEGNRIRRDIIRRTYDNARARGDRHVYMVDGETLFGITDRDLCTVDGVHPTDLGFFRMANTLEPVLREILAGEAGAEG